MELDLNKIRQEINSIDDEISALFEKRMLLAKDVAEYKRQNDMAVYDRRRERDIINRISSQVSDDLSSYAKILYSTLFQVSRSYQFKKLIPSSPVTDKMKKAGFTVSKSDFVNAPIINELPMAVECRLLKFNEDGICIGEIVNISIDEKVLGEDGVVDPEKLEAITFDPYHNAYLKLGEKVGNAFSDGKKLK